MKRIIAAGIILTTTLLTTTAQKVPKFLEKAMAAQAPAEIEFYSDAQLSQKINSIGDGTYEFYVKVPIKKNLAQKCGKYMKVELAINWSTQRSGVYSHFEELDQTLSSYAKGDGYMTYKVDFKDEDKSDLLWYYIQDSEAEVTELIAEFEGGRNRNETLARGSLQLDLSNGNDQYMEYILDKKSDFEFTYNDDFIDDDLKNEVIQYYKAVKNISITNFAWGERVPYTEKLTNYRRQTAVVTWKIEDEGTCYYSMLTVFTSTPYPRKDYTFDGQSAHFNNSERLPCEKIMN